MAFSQGRKLLDALAARRELLAKEPSVNNRTLPTKPKSVVVKALSQRNQQQAVSVVSKVRRGQDSRSSQPQRDAKSGDRKQTKPTEKNNKPQQTELSGITELKDRRHSRNSFSSPICSNTQVAARSPMMHDVSREPILKVKQWLFDMPSPKANNAGRFSEDLTVQNRTVAVVSKDELAQGSRSSQPKRDIKAGDRKQTKLIEKNDKPKQTELSGKITEPENRRLSPNLSPPDVCSNTPVSGRSSMISKINRRLFTETPSPKKIEARKSMEEADSGPIASEVVTPNQLDSDEIILPDQSDTPDQPIPSAVPCILEKSKQAAFPHNVVTPGVKIISQPVTKVKKSLFSKTVCDGSPSTLNQIHSGPEAHSITEDILAAGIDPLGGILVLPLEPVQHEAENENSSNHGDTAPNLDHRVLQLHEAENVVIENIEIEPSENILDSTQDENDNTNNSKKRKRQSVPADKTPPKKRKVERTRWKAAVAKEALNSGLAHVTPRGKERAARSMKPGCGESCNRGCRGKITDEQRQIQFQKFWGTKDKQSQWLMLGKLVSLFPVKRRRVDCEDNDYYRKFSYEYHLPAENSQLVTVCQTMFLHTFDVSIKTVKSALTKNSPDKRGKHSNRRRLNQVLLDSVKTHIKRFPVVESHYCRVDTRRKYLNEDLSVAQMHRLYLMEHDKADPNTATLRQYRDIFNTYFNLGFFKPKKDQCFICAEWKLLPQEKKLALPEKAAEIADHVKKKQIVRKMKREDKADSRDKEKNPDLNKMRVISFDLQKVFLTPRSDVGEFFYKRKLSSYNFTVYDCTMKEAYCYCWDQTIGDRGANEMASYIYDYILFLLSKGVTKIIIYSDSCAAQNKNQFLFSMYYWISTKHSVTIIHRYLEKGHTQMEADNVHGRIEKKIRNKDLYLPQQWYGFIKSARVKKPHYVVKEVTQKDILNMKELGNYFQWSKIPITQIREIIFDVDFPPGSVSFRKDLETESTVVCVLKKKPGRPVQWATFQPPKPAYREKRPLKPKLVKDLKWFLEKKYIPAEYEDRFRALFEYETDERLEGEEEDDTPQEVIPEARAIAALDAAEYDSDPDVPEATDVGADQPSSTAHDNDSTDSEAYD